MLFRSPLLPSYYMYPVEAATGYHSKFFIHFLGLSKRSPLKGKITFSSVQLLSRVPLLVTPWTAARQASLSISNSQSLLKLMFIKSAMPSNHLIVCCSLLLPPSIVHRIRVLPISQFFTSSDQNIGVSASTSVLPMNIQD